MWRGSALRDVGCRLSIHQLLLLVTIVSLLLATHCTGNTTRVPATAAPPGTAQPPSAATASAPTAPVVPPPVTFAPDISDADVCNCSVETSGGGSGGGGGGGSSSVPPSASTPPAFRLLQCPKIFYIDLVLNYTMASDFTGPLQEVWLFLKEVCRYPLEPPIQGQFGSFDTMRKYHSYAMQTAKRQQLCTVASQDQFYAAKQKRWSLSEQCALMNGLPAARVIPSHALQQPVLQYQTNQFLVTVAVLGNASAVADIAAALAAVAQLPSGEHFVAPNFLGVASVHRLPDNGDVEVLQYKSFAPNADGLSLAWIAMLVCGTVLLCVAIDAMAFRSVFSEMQPAKGDDDDSGEEDAAGGGGDDDDLDDFGGDGADAKHAAAWEERNLDAEMTDLLERKMRSDTVRARAAGDLGGGANDFAGAGLNDEDDDDDTRDMLLLRQRRTRRPADPARHQQTFTEHLHAELTLALPPDTREDHQSFLEKRLKLREATAANRLREQRERDISAHLMLTHELPPEMQQDSDGGEGGGDGGGGVVDDDGSPAVHRGDRSDHLSGVDASGARTLGLAARRMSRMMSSMKFSATPYAAESLFRSQGEVNRHLQGGSVGSHLAMASDRGDTLDRIQRARFSKLYFAPKVLTDQMYNTDDSASDGDEGVSRRRRQGLMMHPSDLAMLGMSPTGSSSRSASPQQPQPRATSGSRDGELDHIPPPPTIGVGLGLTSAGKLAAAAARARATTAVGAPPLPPPPAAAGDDLDDPLDAVGPPPTVGATMVLASVGKLAAAAFKARSNLSNQSAAAAPAASSVPRRMPLPGASSDPDLDALIDGGAQPAGGSGRGSQAATPVGSGGGGGRQQPRSSITTARSPPAPQGGSAAPAAAARPAAAANTRARMQTVEESLAVDIDDL